MSMIESYKELISGFIDATQSEKIVWKKQNPTTFFVETNSGTERALVSIQKVELSNGPIVRTADGHIKRRPNIGFLFTVKNESMGELVIQINSLKDADYLPLLSRLYEISEFSTERKNIDFLKGIIDGIN